MYTEATNELLQLENRYWQALKDQDVNACTDLSADPCLVAGAQGVGSFSKEQMRTMMEKQRQYTLNDFKLKDVNARMITPDLGIIAYTVHEKLTVDGKPLVLEAADSSTWARTNGRWECVLHTEASLGEPFGRDRVKKA